jgi:hypothetical protein
VIPLLTPTHQGPDILNQYEWTTAHPNLPFKSSSYFAIKAKHARSKKVPKQILLLEQTRGVITTEGSGSGTNTPAKKGKGTGGNTSTNGSTKNGKRKKVDPEPGPETEMEASVQQERGTAQDPEFKETQSGVDVSMQTEPPSTSTGPTQDPLLPRNGPPKRQVISCKLFRPPFHLCTPSSPHTRLFYFTHRFDTSSTPKLVS